MDEQSFSSALSLFHNGEYERALDIIVYSGGEILSPKERQLAEQCKHLVTEQYVYIIKEYIQQGDYNAARVQKERYKEKYGYNVKVESIEVPTRVIPDAQQNNADKGTESDSKKTFTFSDSRYWYVIGGIAVVLIAVVAVWQCSKDDDMILASQITERNNSTTIVQPQSTPSVTVNTYEEKSDAIVKELIRQYGSNIEVEHRYPELSKYCTFNLTDGNTSYLLIYDLEKGYLKRIDTEKIQTTNGKEVILFFFSTSMNQENGHIIISGNNGAYSMGCLGFNESVLELNPLTWTIKEICSGNNVTKTKNGYIAHKAIITELKDDVKHSEYVVADVYYDIWGNLIAPSYNGHVRQLKGLINNRYMVTMQLSIQDKNIYGKYHYGENDSNNSLYLYGGISKSGDVALLEFNKEGQQTGVFKGRFADESFHGTFTNYKQVEMPFELYWNSPEKSISQGASEQPQQTNKTESTITKTTSLPDKDPEFPGGMSNLKKYISANIQYPAISRENGISGKVRVSYIINEDGSISDVEVIESVDPYLDKEAIRVISSMPKWSPGVRNGKYVKIQASSYVTFRL